MKNNLYRDLNALEAYIETPNKFKWYSKVFESYDINGVEKFSLNWSWWAFFFAPIQLAYRKCYLEAFIIWIIQFFFAPTGFGGLILSAVFGVISPWIIYKKYRNILDKVEFSDNDYDTKIEMIKKLGGVDRVARNITIIFQFFLLFIIICNFLLLLGFNLFFFSFMSPFIFIY